MSFREMDPGSYLVLQPSTTEIGRVYVEGTARVLVVEHWVLFDGYVHPTTTVALEVRAATSGYSSLSDFMTAMQNHVTSTGKAATYIKATCAYDTITP